MASQDDHDLLPDQTEGFKVGEKKTLAEYKNMGRLQFHCLFFYGRGVAYMASSCIAVLFSLHLPP